MIEPYSRRNRQSQGQDAYTYDNLPAPLRVQIIHVWEDVIRNFAGVVNDGPDVIFASVRQAVCEELGVFELTRHSRTAMEDVCNFFLQERSVEKCLDVIEIVFFCITRYVQNDRYVNFDGMHYVLAGFETINARFKQHAVGYEFRDGKMIRIDSGFIHTEVVSPALTVLQESYLSGANQEFFKAHEHFRHARFGESINECLKAFESTMKSICHKRGWPYHQTDTANTLLTICHKNGLFPPYMQSSLMAVATVRNKLSGHGQGVQQIQISQDDAAFQIHATAANILYLVSREKRI